MEYTTRLPAVHLGGEALLALETALRDDCTSSDLEVRLEYRSITYRYSSLAEIERDETLPNVAQSFEVTLSAMEGRIELVADGDDNEFNMQLSGDRDWVESKRRSIEAFFNVHGATVRTFLERYLAICTGLLTVAATLFVYYSGHADLLGMRSPVDSALFASLALIGGGVLHLLLNQVYPYALIVPAEPAGDRPVYLNR